MIQKKLAALFVLVLILILLVWPVGAAQPGSVLVLTANGSVTPVMISYLQRGIAAAEAQNAEAVLIELNTPGGQIDLTREIIQLIVNANVPVMVYVFPSGGYAASAGTFITLSAHVAAMAPQTSIGAASPVDPQGGAMDETMRAKLENILMADMENLAERRGEKAVTWAKSAITEAKAAGANEALELGIIDFIAKDAPDLLAQADGLTVTVRGQARVLHTANAPITRFNMTFAEQILAVILRPEIAFILVSIGFLAILYELSSPGGYIGGVIGVICMVVGMYALGQLPVNFAGVGLMVLAIVLFAAEVFAPSHGALTIAGVISLTLAGLLLFDESALGYKISLTPIIATSVSLGISFFFIMGKALATLRMKPVSGPSRLVGATGVVKIALNPTGLILADGTRWQATLESGAAEVGELVEITAVNGLKLTVKRKTG